MCLDLTSPLQLLQLLHSALEGIIGGRYTNILSPEVPWAHILARARFGLSPFITWPFLLFADFRAVSPSLLYISDVFWIFGKACYKTCDIPAHFPKRQCVFPVSRHWVKNIADCCPLSPKQLRQAKPLLCCRLRRRGMAMIGKLIGAREINCDFRWHVSMLQLHHWWIIFVADVWITVFI